MELLLEKIAAPLATDWSGVEDLDRGVGVLGADGVLDLGHPGGSSDEDDVVDVGHGESLGGQHAVDDLDGGLDKAGGSGLELLPGDGEYVLLAVVREGALGGLRGGEPLLDGLGVVDQALPDVLVLHDGLGVVPGLLGDLLDDELGDLGVPVLSSQEPLSVGGDGGERGAVDLEDGHIEGSASEVVDQDPLLVAGGGSESEGDRGGGGLVDDGDVLESGDGSGGLGGVPLVLAEVGRAGDDRFLDVAAVVVVEVVDHLPEDDR
jgi:hypothetical protein